ncbi:hypothetical protein BV20DRAFT_953482 [Pilatotrama ljubarskyi]|nr:hypothetical protein BV20DRAFT_953482 [Pilatotrama ljubarskyi]
MALPRKRRRESVASDSSSATDLSGSEPSFECDEEFWFEDGTVVLLAGRTRFRVYRGLLAAQSEVLRDILSSSSPSAGEEFQGCPVVRLTDSPEDLRRLLRALLPVFFPESHIDVLNFDQLSAVLRLAHKYRIADVLRQAIAALKGCFFPAWEDYLKAEERDHVELPCYTKVEDVHAIPAIHLARLVGCPEILPYAFYRCCRLRGRIVDGWKREDGTIEHLCREDVARCLDGLHRLAMAEMELTDDIVDVEAADGCATPRSCKSEKVALLHDMMPSFKVGSNLDVLGTWKLIIGNGPLCPICKDDMLERDIAERQKLWKSLPAIFGLKECDERCTS